MQRESLILPESSPSGAGASSGRTGVEQLRAALLQNDYARSGKCRIFGQIRPFRLSASPGLMIKRSAINKRGGSMRSIVLAFLCAILAVPAAFAQSSGYRIQAGDSLAVTVLEDDTLNRQVLVLPDGRISVPLAGSVTAAGRTVETVEAAIADRLASNFAVRPSVFVSVVGVTEELDTFPIYVLGQVGTPGVVEVEPGTTLLQAIALSGGLDRFAATKRIQLRRTDASTGQERLYLFNFKAVERGGSIESMITLREGDVILVPERRLFE
jgi:polysaccharide export outer membrane protein